MYLNKSISILEALASGCSPDTGEVLEDGILNDRDVIRALQFAIDELKKQEPVKKKQGQSKPWEDLDFFKQETFNDMSQEDIHQLKSKISYLGLSKTEDLPEYLIKARKKHKRSHEPWTDEEHHLFKSAIKRTNDLKLLSECFGRSKYAIESYIQKAFYGQKLR